MSSVESVVRAFLDRLERGEGSAEDLSLADRLAWWASGWWARGAVEPVAGNGRYPDKIVSPVTGHVVAQIGGIEPGDLLKQGVVADAVLEAQALAEASGPSLKHLAAKVPTGAVPWSAGHDLQAEAKPLPHRLERALFEAFLVDAPPAEVVASVDAPAKWNRPGKVSVPDLEFAELLRRDYAGEWVEVGVGEMTWTQRHWLAQKLTGSGKAYRPAGSFEAALVREGSADAGRMFVRAVKEVTDSSVPVDPAPAVDEAVQRARELVVDGARGEDEPRGSQGRVRVGRQMSKARRWEHLKAPVKAVAVIDPPAPAANDRPRPKPGETWPEWTEFAEAIRSYDGAWVEIEVSDRNAAGRGNMATAIRGQYNAFRPVGTFEATVQGGRLYARWRKGSKRG